MGKRKELLDVGGLPETLQESLANMIKFLRTPDPKLLARVPRPTPARASLLRFRRETNVRHK